VTCSSFDRSFLKRCEWMLLGLTLSKCSIQLQRWSSLQMYLSAVYKKYVHLPRSVIETNIFCTSFFSYCEKHFLVMDLFVTAPRVNCEISMVEMTLDVYGRNDFRRLWLKWL
jgi:hypothetical protein